MVYSSDQQQLRVCNEIRSFELEPSVMVTVCFNRVQYAKLMSRNIGVLRAFDIPSEQSLDHKASVLGMKITCGFEMLINKGIKRRTASSNRGSRDAAIKAEDEAPMSDFLKALERVGHFENLQTASEALEQRKSRAKQHFAATTELFISQAAQSVDSELALYRSDRVDLPSDSDPAIDEDDSWLMLEPDELDALMRKAEALVSEIAPVREEFILWSPRLVYAYKRSFCV
ncbi:hypothetical protein LPJ56_000395 [Coemansia sp. RSA 2599]|nr:hypothetical protein LPJ56_000395 [Coemansia sp. RSA 2599]